MTELTDEQLKKVIEKVSRPVYEYFLKRMQKEFFSENKKMDLNEFTNLFLICMSSIDGNLLTWLQQSLQRNSGKKIEIELLSQSFYTKLHEHLGVVFQ